MYPMSRAVGPLLLVYIAIYALSLVGVAAIAAGLGLRELTASITDQFPRSTMATLCAAIALLMRGMWIPRILSVVGSELEDTRCAARPPWSPTPWTSACSSRCRPGRPAAAGGRRRFRRRR
jgi:hypothetical protein